MRMTIRPYAVLAVLAVAATALEAQPQSTGQNADLAWTGSVEQKVFGLMTVWAEAKYNFPFFDQRPGLNWDEKAKERIPRVIAAPDLDSYYKVLTEFAALLKDGHTAVNPPGWPFPPGMDKPAVELQAVEGKFVVARVGDTAEIEKQQVQPGLEVLEIDGMPVREYFAEHVLRHESRGTKQADESIELWHILDGPKGSATSLKVKDLRGVARTVTLTRDSSTRSGTHFQWRLVEWYTAQRPVDGRMLDGGVFYVRLSNFDDEKLVAQFQEVFDAADWSSVRGVILDVRFNPGGDSALAYAIVSHFIDEPVKAGTWRSPRYVPAFRSWNLEPKWEEGTLGREFIEPRAGKRYSGPLVVLTGPATYSAAEDFLVPLHAAGRAVLVGEKSAGSTGNPLRVALPGGGNFRVVTLDCRYPDGRAFVGIGIQPDVEVHPTQADLASGYDRVLAEAVDVIENRQPPAAR
jgi:carboxyl-terminal processing protease